MADEKLKIFVGILLLVVPTETERELPVGDRIPEFTFMLVVDGNEVDSDVKGRDSVD